MRGPPGHLLLSHGQTLTKVVITPRTEMTVQCRVNPHNFSPLGLVEVMPDGPPVATSLNRPGR